MCLILGAGQCFAIKGGPVYGGGQVSVTGTYAGVMVPVPTVLDPGPPEVTLTDNSLVLFAMKIPQTGLASGIAVVFRNGFFYSGGIQGSADPDSAQLTGIVSTSFEQDRQSGTTTITEHYEGNGQFVNAKIAANTNPTSAAAARIRGQASLTYILGANATNPAGDSGGPILYRIKGFKQSQSA